MKTTLLLFLGLATTLGGTSNAQTARFAGESLIITDQCHRIRIADVIEPYSDCRVVHAIQKRGKDYYVVIGVRELSRGYPSRGGNCGSGIEAHIDWIHIRAGNILKRESGLYLSCFRSRDGYRIEWEKGVLHWSTTGGRMVNERDQGTSIEVNYSWTFDPGHPERGIEERAEDAKPAPQ